MLLLFALSAAGAIGETIFEEAYVAAQASEDVSDDDLSGLGRELLKRFPVRTPVNTLVRYLETQGAACEPFSPGQGSFKGTRCTYSHRLIGTGKNFAARMAIDLAGAGLANMLGLCGGWPVRTMHEEGLIYGIRTSSGHEERPWPVVALWWGAMIIFALGCWTGLVNPCQL